MKKRFLSVALAAAVATVSYTHLSAVSINQIIKEAEISRGSFYTYFEDKDDLMRYMLRGFRDTLRKKVFEFLEEENGNPFRLCIRLLKDWIKTGSERITFQIHRKDVYKRQCSNCIVYVPRPCVFERRSVA